MGGKSSSVTVGYWYSMGIHMGIGRGPIDELCEVRVGDRTAWSGLTDFTSPITSSGSLYINAPNLFGGEKQEGGIQGTMDIMMGEKTQGINSRLAAMLGGLVPAFRGITTFFFDGRICALNPYPKPWKFRIRRSQKGWDGDVWYPEKIDIWLCGSIKAMNAAHIIYECATNRSWGRGLPRTRIDDASFRAAADRLYAECMGLCVRWNRTDDLQTFVQNIIDHIGGSLYIDRGTGLLTLKLLRDDYDHSALPVFDYNSGLLEIQEDANATADNLINEVILTYHDQITDEDRQVRIHNIASIQSQGAIYSHSVTYQGISCPDLALRVAQRDLRASGLSLKKFKIVCDRRAWKIAPGGVFKVTALERGLSEIILRAGRIEDSTDGTGRITIQAVEDVFGLPDTAYVEIQPSNYTIPDPTPHVITNHRLLEVTYRDTRRAMSNADFNARTPNTANVMLIAARPNSGAMDFVPATHTGTADYATYGFTPFAPFGYADEVLRNDSFMILKQLPDFSTAMTELARGGAGYLGDEIVNVTGILDSDATLGWIKVGITRGCVDTVPAKHPHGEKFYLYERANGSDRKDYVLSDVVYGKHLTRTQVQLLSLTDAEEDTLTIADRFDKPYPPGKVQIGGIDAGSIELVSGDIVITWAHRNRITQADQLIDTQASSITPETGTTYTVNIRKASDNSLIRGFTGITGTTQTYTDADAVTDGYEANIIVEIFAVRDGLNSWQSHEIPLRHYAAGATGYGWNYGNNYGS